MSMDLGVLVETSADLVMHLLRICNFSTCRYRPAPVLDQKGTILFPEKVETASISDQVEEYMSIRVSEH